MRSTLLFIVAGLFEIGGGYLVWLWMRDHRPGWMGILGFLLLALYGVVPYSSQLNIRSGEFTLLWRGVYCSIGSLGLEN